jgi:hypothetical protein
VYNLGYVVERYGNDLFRGIARRELASRAVLKAGGAYPIPSPSLVQSGCSYQTGRVSGEKARSSCTNEIGQGDFAVVRSSAVATLREWREMQVG